MPFSRARSLLFLAALATSAAGLVAQQSSATVPYTGFSGERFDLYPWYGQNVVFLTPTNTLDTSTMKVIIGALDSAWIVREQLSSRDLLSATTLNGRDIVAVLPSAAIPGCYACTFIGLSSTEVSPAAFDALYDSLQTGNRYEEAIFLYPGRSTPAYAGDKLVLYGVGLNSPNTMMLDGPETQSRRSLTTPSCQIDAATVEVEFAGVVSPGLYQVNALLPISLPDGNHTIVCGYGGSTSAGLIVTRQSLPTTQEPHTGFPHMFSTALAVPLPARLLGSLVPNQSNFFKINLSQESKVRFELSGSHASKVHFEVTRKRGFSGWLFLYNTDGTLKNYVSASESAAGVLIATLPTGSWTFSVSWNVNSTPGSYQLIVRPAP